MRAWSIMAAATLGASPLTAQNAQSDSAAKLSAEASELYAWSVPVDTARVITLLTRAATLYRGAANQREEGRTLARLGRVYFDRGQVDSALANYTLALERQRSGGDTIAARTTAQQMQRASAINLLNHSPLLNPSMTVGGGARYVQQARRVLTSVPGQQPGNVTTTIEATRALEAALGNYTIVATVRSEPSKINVRYRRLVDSAGRELTVTTNSKIPLMGALYAFEAKDPDSGTALQQRISCTTNCTVLFTFRRPADTDNAGGPGP